MALKDIVFGLKLNDSDFQKGIQGANKGLKKLDNQKFSGLRKGLSNLTKDLGGLGKSIGKSIKGIAMAGTAVFGVGVAIATAIGAGITKAMGAAIEAREIDAKLKNSLSKIGQAGAFDQLDALSARMQKAFRMDDEETRAGFQVLIDGGMKVQDVMKNAGLVADVAKANNLSFADAADKVSRAFNGEARSLKDLGIFLKSTGNRAKDAQIAMGMLQQKFGGAAAATAAAMSPFESFKLTLDDTIQTIGSRLLPVIEPMIESFGAWFESFAASGELDVWINRFVDGFKTVAEFARFVGQSISNIFQSFKDGTMGDFLVEVIQTAIEVAKSGLTLLGTFIGNAALYGAPKLMGILVGKLVEMLQDVLGPKVSKLLGLDTAKAVAGVFADDPAWDKANSEAMDKWKETGGTAISKLANSAFDRFAGDGGSFAGGDGGAAMRQAQQQVYNPQAQMQAKAVADFGNFMAARNQGIQQRTQKIQLISQQPMSAVSLH